MDSDRIPETLHAPGLLLRPWEERDLGALVEAYSEITDEADGLKWLEERRAWWEAGTLYTFAVIDTESGQVAGCVVLKRPDPAGDSAEVGYWTAAAVRGRGIAPRAVGAVAEWAYGSHGLRRLDLFHAVDNAPSCRVAEKSGFPFVEILPAAPPWPTEGHLHVSHAPSR
ncbi:GNAT family N-acetyltransferase [Streptomyces sp. NBC_01465]|uniref:GNAT family N-acetyltransferase n=1 Tax=Streptomyces sp. NBC_01465 TaxID=2903878 RepID=UPI002E3435AF|nr:GNAT family N-acetyltransferase [Streptomyces sp. NBC_01465]